MFLGLMRPAGDVLGFALLMGTGCGVMYAYYATVYSTIHDVVEPSLRGTAMALYFFAMYVLGASLGPVGTGLASDYFTFQAASAAGRRRAAAVRRADDGRAPQPGRRSEGLRPSRARAVPSARPAHRDVHRADARDDPRGRPVRRVAHGHEGRRQAAGLDAQFGRCRQGPLSGARAAEAGVAASVCRHRSTIIEFVARSPSCAARCPSLRSPSCSRCRLPTGQSAPDRLNRRRSRQARRRRDRHRRRSSSSDSASGPTASSRAIRRSSRTSSTSRRRPTGSSTRSSARRRWGIRMCWRRSARRRICRGWIGWSPSTSGSRIRAGCLRPRRRSSRSRGGPSIWCTRRSTRPRSATRRPSLKSSTAWRLTTGPTSGRCSTTSSCSSSRHRIPTDSFSSSIIGTRRRARRSRASTRTSITSMSGTTTTATGSCSRSSRRGSRWRRFTARSSRSSPTTCTSRARPGRACSCRRSTIRTTRTCTRSSCRA